MEFKNDKGNEEQNKFLKVLSTNKMHGSMERDIIKDEKWEMEIKDNQYSRASEAWGGAE